MTTEQLNEKFKNSDKYNRDFIRWAAEYGIIFDDTEISNHRKGKRRMTKSAQLMYLIYFKQFE